MTSAQTHDRRVRFRDLSRLAPGGYDKLYEAFPQLRGPLFGPFTRRPRVRTFHGEGHAVMVTDPAEYVHSVLDSLRKRQ